MKKNKCKIASLLIRMKAYSTKIIFALTAIILFAVLLLPPTTYAAHESPATGEKIFSFFDKALQPLDVITYSLTKKASHYAPSVINRITSLTSNITEGLFSSISSINTNSPNPDDYSRQTTDYSQQTDSNIPATVKQKEKASLNASLTYDSTQVQALISSNAALLNTFESNLFSLQSNTNNLTHELTKQNERLNALSTQLNSLAASSSSDELQQTIQ